MSSKFSLCFTTAFCICRKYGVILNRIITIIPKLCCMWWIRWKWRFCNHQYGSGLYQVTQITWARPFGMRGAIRDTDVYMTSSVIGILLHKWTGSDTRMCLANCKHMFHDLLTYVTAQLRFTNRQSRIEYGSWISNCTNMTGKLLLIYVLTLMVV